MKLHNLSERHREVKDVRPSVETQNQYEHEPSSNPDETRVSDNDDSTPTLIGLVIISSVLAIVTLSPFSQPQPVPRAQGQTQPSRTQTASPPDSEPSEVETIVNPDRLRIIAELDFSQRDQDVWNALGVAIVAMQIRREAMKANYGTEELDVLEGMSMVGDLRLESEMDGDGGSRREVEDDPDL